jgi:hypothetical protein
VVAWEEEGESARGVGRVWIEGNDGTIFIAGAFAEDRSSCKNAQVSKGIEQSRQGTGDRTYRLILA